MSEGNLWKVTWRRAGQGYRVTVVGSAELHGTGDTLEDALERLEDQLIERVGDAVPHFEWVNPLPEPIGIEGRDFLYLLCGHHRIDVPYVERLLQRPRCERCHNYSSPRTTEPITLPRRPHGDLPFTQFDAQLCSARLARFLKLETRDDLQLLPIIIGRKETTDYLELRTNVAREWVAKKGAPSGHAFRCQECGASTIVYLPEDADYFQFVARSSMPSSLPRVFPVGSGHAVRLAVRGALRRRVIRSDEFKDVRSRKVGILDDASAIPQDDFFRGMA